MSLVKVSNQINGAAIIEIQYIGKDKIFEIFSGIVSPMRLGTSSPNTNEKKVSVTTITDVAIGSL